MITLVHDFWWRQDRDDDSALILLDLLVAFKSPVSAGGSIGGFCLDGRDLNLRSPVDPVFKRSENFAFSTGIELGWVGVSLIQSSMY